MDRDALLRRGSIPARIGELGRASSEDKAVIGLEALTWYVSAGLLGLGATLCVGKALPIEVFYSVVDYVILAACGLAVGMAIVAGSVLDRVSSIEDDLTALSWISYDPTKIKTKKTSLSRVRELHNVEVSVLMLAKNITQVSPFLPFGGESSDDELSLSSDNSLSIDAHPAFISELAAIETPKSALRPLPTPKGSSIHKVRINVSHSGDCSPSSTVNTSPAMGGETPKSALKTPSSTPANHRIRFDDTTDGLPTLLLSEGEPLDWTRRTATDPRGLRREDVEDTFKRNNTDPTVTPTDPPILTADDSSNSMAFVFPEFPPVSGKETSIRTQRKFSVTPTDGPTKVFEFNSFRKSSRRFSLSASKSTSSVSEHFTAYDQSRRQSTASQDGVDVATGDSAAVRRLNSKLRNNIKKRKGTVLSIDFSIGYLVEESVFGTYDLAEILISNVLDIVRNHGGMILQARADGVVATWNTLTPCNEHGRAACQAALEVKSFMESVEESKRVSWSAAITSGMMCSGTIGNSRHKSQFVLSEKVEQARFLNHLCDLLGADILISESVRQATFTRTPSRPVDVILWSPDDPSEVVYELLPENSTIDLLQWKRAFSSFISGDWDSEDVDALGLLRFTDIQAERLHNIATYPEGEGSPPRPYSRRLEGWQIWDHTEASLGDWAGEEVMSDPPLEDQTSQGGGNGFFSDDDDACGFAGTWNSTRSNAFSSPKRKKLTLNGIMMPDRPGSQDELQPAELLKQAIVEEGASPVYDSDDSECSDDVPPGCFVDRSGGTWRRSDKKLGAGAFGEVWLGMSGEGSLVALKCIKIESSAVKVQRPRSLVFAAEHSTMCSSFDNPSPSLDDDDDTLVTPTNISSPLSPTLESAINEVKMLSTYKDDSIVCFITCGVYDRYIVVAMEYVSGGSLASVLESFGGSVPTNTAKRYTSDVVRGLNYLHSKGIIHRDLKPANVLIQTDGQCKISDFGTSALSSMITDTKAIGTPLFMSPESCNGSPCFASDVWSLGHTVAQMLTGHQPFAWSADVPKGQHNFMRWLSKPDGEVPLPPKSQLRSDEAYALVAKMLVRDPKMRPTAAKISYDPFLL